MDIPKQIQRNLEIYEQTRQKYPTLSKAGSPLSIPTSPIIGRDTTELRKTLRTPEKANAILLGEPGVGKTAFMQSFAYNDSSTSYLVISINVERIIEDNEGDKDAELANGLQNLVTEVADYCRTQNVIMVLFIDEFHRIPMLSPTAVEALKPILEKSASNGFRIVGATTFEEYDEHIAPNRALDQRMLRITMTELSRGPVISILKSKAELYKLTDYAEDDIYETIYNTSKEILISNSQPRASIDIFNAMIGTVTKDEYMKDGELVREYATPTELGIQGEKILCRHILNDVIQRSYGIDIDNKVRVNDIRTALNARIYNQEFAVNKVMGHLEMILAGFNDPTRPKCSLLFTGPTGTGKTELTKVVAETMGLPFRRFDMSRYPSDDDARRFADDLSQAAWSSPNGLLLIDEIEKSGPAVINNLLQVLDDARLTSANNPNRVISFTGNIIFMTTNVAREVYKHMKQFDGDNPTNIDTDLIYKALADDDKFASEVLGRIDGIVPFLGLPEDALTRIVQRELDKNIDIITTDKRKVLVSDDIIPYIVVDRTSQDNERGGARDAKRNVKSIVLQEIAKYLANEPEEVPIIIHLVGEARFKYQDNSDPLNAHVALTECHPQWTIDSWMAHLRNQLKINLIDAGIYVPKSWTSEQFIQHIYPQIQRGIRKFKTFVDDDRIWIDQA